MNFNKDSNRYILLYSIGLVAVAAILLSLASVWLTPYQQRNKEIEKKWNILQAVQKTEGINEAKDRDAYIEAIYERYITQSKIVNAYGLEVEGNAFDVDLTDEIAKPAEDRLLPVFICTNDDSSKLYILSLRGTGLWGPIWGYVAVQSDMNTICGAVFDHKGETPGLGAEIATREFHQQFIGKQLFDNGVFTSIEVKKGGQTKSQPHAVDAISGGTITSESLQRMLAKELMLYVPFFKAQQRADLLLKKEIIREEPVQPVAPPVVYRRPKIEELPTTTDDTLKNKEDDNEQHTAATTENTGVEQNLVPEEKPAETGVNNELPTE
jgi:Na+-transporting NADH:ubiquinone oxidoreductase subunit C